MGRRYSRRDDMDEDIAGIIVFILIGSVIYAGLEYKTDRGHFWQIIIYMVLIIIAAVGLFIGFVILKNKIKQNKSDRLMSQINKAGLEDYIKNFINRFGLEKTKSKGRWNFRGYNFDWERLRDFRNVLQERGVKVSQSDFKDIDFLLREYIQKKEEALTRESIKVISNKFSNLSGSEFENLLYRLYEKMGYMVERTGKTGDQGADLILNKGNERILVQAKRYEDFSVGNSAVQQAVAAKNHYDCNMAVVVATTHFTNEALALAKTNSVDLISKRRIQEMLMNYLKESWD
jgi:HJR/Mrr/RecB family endonuclease